MSDKTRVYELAKELGMDNKGLLDLLRKAEIEVKNHMTVLTDETVTAFRNVYGRPVEAQPEPKAEAPAKPKSLTAPEKKAPTDALTSEEQAIVRRISKPDDDWQTITEESMGDFSLAEDMYKLPKEAQEAQDRKEFAFRWILKEPGRIDQIASLDVPMKWWIVNSTQPPIKGLNRHVDPVHGGIQRMDQILVFKPWWMHEKHQTAKMRIAQAKDESGDIKNRDGRKEAWGEWRSGEQNKIGGSDEVMAEAVEMDTAVNE